MRRPVRILLMAGLLIGLFAAAPVFAQNLLDNDAYKKAVQLRQEAQQALDAGNYDQAQQLSKQAEEYAKQAIDMAKQMELAYRATNWLERARERITYGKSIEASKYYPAKWTSAEQHFADAQKGYDNKQFANSITESQTVVELLKDIRPATVASTNPKPQPQPQPPAQTKSEPVLPEYYTVRLIPDRRDCFWRIAGYPFVYGNPLKWPLLYNANKQILQDPNNPDLIQPGMVFKIPSLNGEKRQGTYQPDK
ncbi:LysM peptidoglycan-binding domain-containing protein [Salinispira pacifica]